MTPQACARPSRPLAQRLTLCALLLGSSLGLSSCTMASNWLGSIGKTAAPAPLNQTSPEDAARAIIGDAQARYTRPSVTGLSGISLGAIDGVLVESRAVSEELAGQFAQLGLKISRSEVVVGTKGGCAAARSALLGAGWTRKIARSDGGDENGTLNRAGETLQYALRTSGQSCVIVMARTTPA